MKISLVLLPALLFFIFVFFSAIDRSEYVLEKKMWKIQQQFTVEAQYGILSKEKSEYLTTMYRNLIQQYPKSGLLPQIYIRIGQIYAVNKDFEKARTSYSEALQRFPQQKDLCSEALLDIGLTYEKENKVAMALETYRQVVKNYPLTDVGLNMPLYIANYCHRLNKDVEAQNAFQEAEGFYRNTAQENPNSSKGFNALRFLSVTYLDQEKWDDAVKIFEKILLEYIPSPYLDSKTTGSMVYLINVVSIEKLKKPGQPIAFYQMLIEKHPGYPLNKFFKDVIVTLQGLKNRKGIIPRYN